MGFSDAAENYAHSSSQGIDRGRRRDVDVGGIEGGVGLRQWINERLLGRYLSVGSTRLCRQTGERLDFTLARRTLLCVFLTVLVATKEQQHKKNKLKTGLEVGLEVAKDDYDDVARNDNWR